MLVIRLLSAAVVMSAAVAFLTPSGATAQEKRMASKELPAAVKESFARQYPGATIRGAAVEKEKGVTYYEIESTDRGTRRDLLYHADGTIAEIEETIPVTDLPAKVTETCASNFPQWKVTRAERVTKDDGTVSFSVTLRNGRKSKEAEFDASGALVPPDPAR